MKMRTVILVGMPVAALVAVALPLSRMIARENSVVSGGAQAPAPCLRQCTSVPLPPVTAAPAPLPTHGLSGEKPACQPDSKPAASVTCALVNSRRIRLNYSISDVGPSGVASVELWATRDGKTWQCHSNEPPPSGPLVVCVAEEGKYGFTIVVKSGVGLVSPRPQTGDEPQLWIEVDETSPKVRLLDTVVGTGADAGTLTVAWTASDTHLTSRPVTICTAASKDGPWTPVATNLPNNGRFVWQMPKELPYELHVRTEVADRAGNVGTDETTRPIRVDLARPRGTILGIDNERKANDAIVPVGFPVDLPAKPRN